MSQSRISRIEHANADSISILDVVQVATLLGLELSVRAFPGGSPLRDAAHVELVGRLRRRVSGDFAWQVEVPMPSPYDQRALDVVLRRGNMRIGVEAEVRLTDVQAVVRRVSLKQRDAGLDCMLLLIRASQWNRRAVAQAKLVMDAAFPLGPRRVLSDLGAGRVPTANGLILL
jgi:hypothetical protein